MRAATVTRRGPHVSESSAQLLDSLPSGSAAGEAR
jgi:hypothetical protein